MIKVTANDVLSIPGYAKDLRDLENARQELQLLRAGVEIPNLTIAGVKKSIRGLEAALENKARLGVLNGRR